jgi:hypothetical protein
LSLIVIGMLVTRREKIWCIKFRFVFWVRKALKLFYYCRLSRHAAPLWTRLCCAASLYLRGWVGSKLQTSQCCRGSKFAIAIHREWNVINHGGLLSCGLHE